MIYDVVFYTFCLLNDIKKCVTLDAIMKLHGFPDFIERSIDEEH